MNLAIETSSLVSSVAVGDENNLKGELTIQGGLTHSEQLVPHIDDLLKKVGVCKKELSSIVVSIGPGSFTGLRIGLATAKAMAYGLDIPMVGIPTPEGIAYNALYADRLIAVLLDAQKKNVYATLFRMHGSTVEVIQPTQVIQLEEVLDNLNHYREPVLFMGEGAILHAAEIVSQSDFFALAPMTMVIPRAGALLVAANERIKNKMFEDPMTVVPYYLRRSEAEVLWEKRKRQETP